MTASEICAAFCSLRLKELKTLPERVLRSVESGELCAAEALKGGLTRGMDDIGERFRRGEVYLPEVMLAAKTMNECLRLLKPFLAEAGGGRLGTAVLGTVRGDSHDIGKNIVKIMLEGKGLRVVDLGTNVEPERFVQCARDEGAFVICASALLTTTMPVMAEICALAAPFGIPVMVGGAPLSAEFAAKIGAVYAKDAAEAADKALTLLPPRADS